MRIPDWTPEQKPQPADLVEAVVQRRGGQLIELDRVLLWSEPVARGWNTYMGAVRTQLAAPRKLRELGILVVALLTGADYEYKHHAPDFLRAGGVQAELDALNALIGSHPRGKPTSADYPALGEPECAVIAYAVQVTLDVKVANDVFARLQASFDTTAIVEITTAIAAYNMVARILVPLQVG